MICVPRFETAPESSDCRAPGNDTPSADPTPSVARLHGLHLRTQANDFQNEYLRIGTIREVS
jgi:hypothetical protein